MEPTIKTEPYKFIYALVLSALTACAAIWVDNPYLTAALAVVTAVGTYFVPNPPKTDSPADPNPGGPTVGDPFV